MPESFSFTTAVGTPVATALGTWSGLGDAELRGRVGQVCGVGLGEEVRRVRRRRCAARTGCSAGRSRRVRVQADHLEPGAGDGVDEGGCPPEKANSPCSGAAIAGSIGRTDRTGPICGGRVEW